MRKAREKFLLFRVHRHKDEQAYGELYVFYAPRIHRYLTFKLPTVSDADELTADVFVRAWQYVLNTQVDNFSALLFRIARNVSANYYRTRDRSLKEVELNEAVVIQAPVETVDALSIENIERCLRRLKDEYRDVVVMRYLEEMSMKEIAVAMDRTENATRVLLHRALKALRRVIDQDEYAQSGPHFTTE